MTLATVKADVGEILRALVLLVAPGSVAELRSLKTKKGTISGYYDDFAAMASRAAGLSGTVPGVYFTLNPVHPALLARRANRSADFAENTTADENIVSRYWLPVDFDPVRPAGISSTDAEHEYALAHARECKAELTSQGWAEPLLGDSGNGACLLFRVDLPNDKDSQVLIERTLQALAQEFSDAQVKIDTAVGNAARIWRVPGTLNCKGDSTVERPHRRARLLEIPSEIRTVTRDQLEALAALARETLPLRTSAHPSKGKGFDLGRWLDEHGIKVESSEPWEAGTKYIFAACPFKPEHTRTAFAIQFSNGALSAGCLHDSCRWKWADLRSLYDPRPEAPAFSDDATALEFTENFGSELRYTVDLGWHYWDGNVWRADKKLFAFTKARETCRAAAKAAAAEPDKARRLASSATVSNVERLARLDPRHIVGVEQWDADPWLLNTPAGTIDLHAGAMHPHRREHFLTMGTTVSPGGDCLLWLWFLARITAGDVTLQAFLQRMVGYCLTGSTREHALFFLYGTGANGKSVFVNAVMNLLGPYARTAPIEMLLASRNSEDRHPCDMAGLRGARMVTAVEIERGSRWAESKLKTLTGADKLTARFMRQDFFEYTPQFKLLVTGNHRPSLRSVDEAIRRRFNLVPFTVTIPPAERDLNLSEKLRAEYPGILRWAIEGCLAWQRDGLNPPAVVRAETDNYFGDEDALGRWITELCILGKCEEATSNALFKSWKEWADSNREFVGSQKSFGQSLAAREGIINIRTNTARKYRGVRLKTFDELKSDERTQTVKTNGHDLAPPHVPSLDSENDDGGEFIV